MIIVSNKALIAEDPPVKITSIADHLISQMVGSASRLQQQNRENTTYREMGAPLRREGAMRRSMESSGAATSSSAYRITISSAAMQKMMAGGS
ncbi:MAG: hypothetical protein HQL90_10295 [Magnetococcales bacterium]|nr:hypothetical protein [Magnetococcales bacterium]